MPDYVSLSKPDVSMKAKDGMVKNNAGGFVFKLTPLKQLERFLILGSDAPTYYASARQMTRDNAAVVIACWEKHTEDTAKAILDVVVNRRAPRMSPSLFAVALGTVSPNEDVRKLAHSLIPRVCTTGTHIFELVSYATGLGKGWGRGFKTAVASWYEDKRPEGLAYQVIKYRNRHGFTHNRLLDLTHPKGRTPAHKSIYNWIVGKGLLDSIPMIEDFERAQELKHVTAKDADLIRRLPWEAFPTELHGSILFWEFLLPHMNGIALLRNLSRFSTLEMTKPLGDIERMICDKLTDPKFVKDSGMHPLNVLVAQKTYSSGKGHLGRGQWVPNANIVAAMDDTFELAFGNVPVNNDRTMIGVDVSGSMSWSMIANSPLSACEAAAAMALVTVRTTPQSYVLGFSNRLIDLNITKKDTPRSARDKAQRHNFGATDTSLLMRRAIGDNINVDKFITYTDNETWQGRHTFQTLQDYRKKSGIKSKSIVCAMTSTGFTIADPSDPYSLDVVGFDTSTPSLIAEF